LKEIQRKDLIFRNQNKNITSVLISIPTPPFGSLYNGLVKFLLNSRYYPNLDIQIDIIEHKWPVVRNLQFKRFLELTDSEYLLTIDSDIIPPTNALRMVKEAKEKQLDYLSAVCFSFQFNEPFAVVMKKDPKGRDGYIQAIPQGKPGIYEVDATGLACVVLSRRLVNEFQGTFKDKIDSKGMLERDADFDFCERIKKVGYKVYIDTRVICDHMKVLPLKRINDLLVKNNDR